jgi:hypothetical protein
VATPDDTSTRRLRLVGNEHRQGAAAIPEDELTAGQAAAFAATVAEVNHSPISSLGTVRVIAQPLSRRSWR